MNGQRIIGITFVAILMLVAIVLLIQAGRFIIGGSDSTNQESVDETVAVTRTIADYIEGDAIATFTNGGEITGTEDYNQIEIEVTPSKRELRIISGYDDVVTTRKQFDNTEEAYAAFMNALAFEGILAQKEATYNDVAGVCPTGERFIYELNIDGIDDDLYSWASSCSRRHGSFDGDRRGVEKLFQKQIPEYRDLTDGIKL